MRTHYKDEAYFTQVLTTIQLKYAEEKKAYDALVAEKNIKFPIPISEFILSTNLVWQITIRYSRGDQVADIANLYEEVADRFIKSWDPEDVVYRHLFDVLTLGVLLEAPTETFAQIGELVTKARLRDYLVDYFLAWRQPRPLHPKLRWQTYRPYKALQEVTQLPPAEARQRMQRYLDRDWYIKSNTEFGYDAHKDAASKSYFFGYWSLGAGAVSKIMSLDDSAWQDSEYYPYDMVQWRP